MSHAAMIHQKLDTDAIIAFVKDNDEALTL